MRIRSLTLERYGPFTGQSLVFQPDAKLHIVFGPNQAGKSCALAAITDLFFKIDARTPYGFLHKPKDLRIAALIEARSGNRLSFQRRKGIKDTLLDPAGAPLPEDCLLPFLGHLTRDVFTHAFGLNTETLRQGAEEMLKSGGEIGASLFAAASGLKGMTDLRQSLDREADAIFAPRAAKERRFYQILERYEEARRAIRDLELKAGDWKALNEEIDRYAERLKEIRKTSRENSAVHARLSRLKRVAPLLRRIDDELAALKSVGILPEVAPGFAERLRTQLEANQRAAAARDRAGQDREEAERDFSSILPDETLLANAGEIEALFYDSGAYEEKQEHIPRIQAEADGYSAELGELAVRLGMSDAAQVVARQPADTVYVATRGLIAEGKKLFDQLDRYQKQISSETETLAGLEDQRGARESVPNPRQLREQLEALGPVLKQLDPALEIERKIAEESKSLERAAARLHPPVADLGALARSPLPSTETMTRFRKEFEQTGADLRRVAEQAAEIAGAIGDMEKAIQAFTAQGPVPSPEVILVERQSRDHAWARLRDSLTGTAATLVGAPLRETIFAFESHGAEADRLADSAVTHAGWVAAYAGESKRLKEEQIKQAVAQERQATLESKHQAAWKDWEAIWSPAGIVPLPPLEMAAWRSQVEALLARLEKNDNQKDHLKAIEETVLAVVPALNALAHEAGIERLEGLEPRYLVQQIQNRLTAIERIWDEASKLETGIGNAQERIAKLRKQEAEAELQVENWATRWRAALPGLGLSAAATVDEAEAALSAWQKVPGTLRERENRQRRVTGMQRDSQAFEARAKAVIEIAASDLLSLPVAAAVRRLNERLTEAAGAQARRDQAANRLEKARLGFANADKKWEESKAELASITAVVPADTDLLELLQRFSRRDEVSKALADHRSQLVSQGDGFTEEQLRQELAEFRVDEATAQLEELSEENLRLETEAREVFANHKMAMTKRTSLQDGLGAEVANQQKKNAEAELLAAVREWLILRFGALLLGGAIEKSRASQHNPLVQRAGDLLATITGGAFTGIGQDFEEDDTPYLVARRSNQETVTVPGLSEGTRDQLFLALRLAYLEDFAKHAEPVPFIGDDIFTSFDEERTANGLSALAAIGDRIQPILFTHHRHVVKLARAKVGGAADVIEILQQ